MKKSLCAILFIITNFLVLKANPISQDSICIIQPNGDTLWSRLQGDEFYHWRSTMDGYVIVRDSNHCFYYAQIEGDTILQPSAMIAHNLEKRTLLEQEYLNLHSESVKEFINSVAQETRMIEHLDTAQTHHAQYVTKKSQQLPVTGKRKILTILVEFEDRQFSREKVEFDSVMNQQIGAVGPNYGSVRQYYQENSYGQLIVESKVIGPIEVPYSYTNYQRKPGEKTTNVKKLVRQVVNQAKDIVDFSTMDGDNDGNVDCVHIVYAGTQYMDSSTDIFIWPHKGRIAPITSNKTSVKDYIITAELNRDGNIAPIGTICHELGHIFGAPDFYDIKQILHPMGWYDIMDSGNQNGKNIYGGRDQESGYCPAHHNPYTKSYIFKWDTPTLIDSTNRTYVLASSTNNKGHIYRIDTKTPGEYFLLENRTAEGFDGEIPNSGLLIYHAHTDLESCIEKGDSINHTLPMKFYLLNADTSQRNGGIYGVSNSSRAYPGKYHDKTMFTSTTIPGARDWNEEAIGVDICFIMQLDYGKVAFTVSPKINGPSQLCGVKDYGFYGYIPSTDTISWRHVAHFETSAMFPALLFSNGNLGNSVTVERGYKLWNLSGGGTMPNYPSIPINSIYSESNSTTKHLPYVGEVSLYATIKSENGTYQMKKDIVLPEYATPSLSQNYALWPINTERTLTDTSCSHIEAENIKWYVRYPNMEYEYVYSGHSATFKPTATGDMTIRVVNECGCEASNETIYTYSVVNAGPMSYPNPVTTTILPIDIIRNDESHTLLTIELWHQNYGRVRTISTTGNRVKLDISGLSSDWYQLILLYNGQKLDSGNVLISL